MLDLITNPMTIFGGAPGACWVGSNRTA